MEAGAGEADGLGGSLGGVVDEGAGLAAGDELAIGQVAAFGEAFGQERDLAGAGQGQGAVGQAHHGKFEIGGDGGDFFSHLGGRACQVVEGAVRFEVGQRYPGGLGQAA